MTKFKFNDKEYSLEQVESAAKQSNLGLDEYLTKTGISRIGGDDDDKKKKKKGVANKGANVTPAENNVPKNTDLKSEGTSSESSANSDYDSNGIRNYSVRGRVRKKELERVAADKAEKDKLKTEQEAKEAKQYDIDVKGIPSTLNKAGSSVWSYSPSGISNLYYKTSQQAIEGYSFFSITKDQQSLYDSYKNALTGGFSYYDFINNEKINLKLLKVL
jgi:hypothetical protein